MADMNNFSNINENFDTIKTLLNSIRAQGILNTSDVDKLLTGINSKLEKINTDEDIDLIKAFLSELKQNLDERHGVLVSKFGAIESLFSNLLKNSNEVAKSGELKELFDIVATNLSVFSREVVSQKETLTDITLRIDAMRSDDTQKKDIIKSISSVKNDIEKLNNGFDSIVISLNENFKTVLKTIAEVDQTDAIKGFTEQLNNIINSSNTILSAIQLIDKKNVQIEEYFDGLATQEDTSNIQRAIIELSAKSQEISNIVDIINQKSYKMDNLSEKIDASVNIIAGLKADIADSGDETKNAILDKLSSIENSLKEISSNAEFEQFRLTIENVFKEIAQNTEKMDGSLASALQDINRMAEELKALDLNQNFNNITNGIISVGDDVNKMAEELKALDLNQNFNNITNGIISVGENIKEKVANEVDKISQMLDVNITRTLSDISSNAEVINSRLQDSHITITGLYEKHFADVFDTLSGLKEIVTQLDENNVSANNAIFSNITDRLAVFENALKTSLEKQEDTVNNTATTLIEHLTGIKSHSENLEYKLDLSAIENSNNKKEFQDLKDAVNNMLALDFVSVVKNFKIDLYAIKQDLLTFIETSDGDISEKLSNDLYNKYNLLINRLDLVEDSMKSVQAEALTELKKLLDNISGSLIDILSYVSVTKDSNSQNIEDTLIKVSESIKDYNLNYIEDVRNIVDIIRTQVETDLQQISKESDMRLSKITGVITDSKDDIKADIMKSYNKLLEVAGRFDSINEALSENNQVVTTNVSEVLMASESVKNDFELKMNTLRNGILDIITEFQKNLTCENADTLSELKFNSENLHLKSIQQSVELKEELKNELNTIIESLKTNIHSLNENLLASTLKVEGANKDIINFVKTDFTDQLNNSIDTIKTNTEDVLSELDIRVMDISDGFNKLEDSVSTLTIETTNSLTSLLAKIMENFSALQVLMQTNLEKSITAYTDVANDVKSDLSNLKMNLEDKKAVVDRHLGHQSDIMKQNYSLLQELITSLDEQFKQEVQIKFKELTNDFNSLKMKLSEVDAMVDEDLSRQISIIEGNFESINLMMVDIMRQTTETLGEKIKEELANASDKMSEALAEELEQYKIQIVELYEELKNQNNEQSEFIREKVFELNGIIDTTLEKQNKNNAAELTAIADQLRIILSENIELSAADYDALKVKVENIYQNIKDNNDVMVESVKSHLDNMTKYIDDNIELQSAQVNSNMQEILSCAQKANISLNAFEEEISSKISEINNQINELKEQSSATLDNNSKYIIEKLSNLHKNIAENSQSNITADYDALKLKLEDVHQNIKENNNVMVESIKSQLDDMIKYIDNNIEIQSTQVNSNMQEISSCTQNTNASLNVFKEDISSRISEIINHINKLGEQSSVTLDDKSKYIIEKLSNLHKNIAENSQSNITADYDALKLKLEDVHQNIKENNNVMVESIKSQLDDMIKYIDNNIEIQSTQVNSNMQEISSCTQNTNASLNVFKEDISSRISEIINHINKLGEQSSVTLDDKSKYIIEKLSNLQKEIAENSQTVIKNDLESIKLMLTDTSSTVQYDFGQKVEHILKELSAIQEKQNENREAISGILDGQIKNEISNLKNNITNLFEAESLNIATEIGNTNSNLIQEFHTAIDDLKSSVDILEKRINEKDSTVINGIETQIQSLSTKFNTLSDNYRDLITTNISALSESFKISNTEFKDTLSKSFTENTDKIIHSTVKLSLEELRTIESHANNILEQLNLVEQNSVVCKDVMSKVLQEHVDIISKNIEKEADLIINDILNEISGLKNSQKDELTSFSTAIGDSVAGYIADSINDLKSYFDIKIDSSVINTKIDELKLDLEKAVNDTTENISKLVELSVFTDAITDLRTTNQVLLDNMADKINSQIINFIKENLSNDVDNKFKLFDKKFTEIITDKYEEIRLISTQYNNSFDRVSFAIQDLISNFTNSKEKVMSDLDKIVNGIENSVDELKACFEDLKTQIINKTTNLSLGEDIKQQILSVEDIVTQQIENLQTIEELCSINLPEITEISAVVKYGIQQSVKDLGNNLDKYNVNIQEEVNKCKTDIITQFINIFNQISFVTEQEEILDFIQEKHSELITILSHIVTKFDKIDSLKGDINLINEKISAIMSSDGNIDYVYSLQDLESDIANLRLVLNEMKNNNKSKEIEDLISSTNSIYTLLDTIKNELPKYETETLKKNFENLSEDILSISTRTNKLLLTSDESYKTLQDNLQDFKLVINDLDERTKNFAHEAGIDRLDNKLAAINTLIQNGAKTNQVFNQIFEYLAEWVDKAGNQINAISDKVETLDDIGQIKVMLEDMRAESQEDSEHVELIEALSNVFEKQAKKIASLEAKLDRLIVDSTINSRSNKVDISPIENTLNRFLVAIDDKMLSQQTKIDAMEEKLQTLMSLIDNKDTAQLTKKVGGMDKQLAKLNKSIEKIASNVVEK